VKDLMYVRVHTKDRIAVLAIDHPPVNALDAATFCDLDAAVRGAQADPVVKVIVITGTGRSFVAGADIGYLAEMATAEDAEALARSGQGLMLRIEHSPKPIIAAINGRYCLGGGNELAMACHMRIAEEQAEFGQPEIRLGLIPGWGGTRRLVHLVGLGKAVELILTGDRISAREALQLGLVNRVVAEGKALDEAMRLAAQLATLSSEGLRLALDCIYSELDMGTGEAMACEMQRFAEMACTYDKGEGLSAFLEKRHPQFEDR
jgi:enoyl-CoA hydratase/carnithine racemase